MAEYRLVNFGTNVEPHYKRLVELDIPDFEHKQRELKVDFSFNWIDLSRLQKGSANIPVEHAIPVATNLSLEAGKFVGGNGPEQIKWRMLLVPMPLENEGILRTITTFGRSYDIGNVVNVRLNSFERDEAVPTVLMLIQSLKFNLSFIQSYYWLAGKVWLEVLYPESLPENHEKQFDEFAAGPLWAYENQETVFCKLDSLQLQNDGYNL